MKAISPRLWLPAILLIITFFITLNDLNAQSVKSPCQCADVPDLINLLNMDNSVLDGLLPYFSMIETTDLVNELLPAPNPNRLTKGDKIREMMRQQMDWVKNQEAKTASGEIDTVTCQPKVQAGSDCLKHIMEERTKTSSEICKEDKLRDKMGEKDDTIAFRPLYWYLSDLSELYEREIKTILKILSGIDPACRPKDWFGIITVYEDISSKITIKTESTEDYTIRAGVIKFNGKAVNQQQSSWQVAGKYINTKFAKEGKRDCTGGLDGPKPDTEYKTSFTMEVSKTGGGPFPITVDLGEPDDKNKVPIGLRIPEMIAKWDFNSVSKRESGCPNDSLKETFLYTTDYPLNSEPLNFEADFILGESKFDASQTISGEGAFQNFSNETAGARQSHTHWINVKLYKLRK